MSDHDFEVRLERMFANPPAVSDAGVFTARVEARLERGERLRSILIGSAGVTGGVFAATQAFGSGVLRRLGEVRLPEQVVAIDLGAGRLLDGTGWAALSGGGEVVWMAAAMLALTVGFLATRFSDVF
jgi:hypothetical protein